MSNKYNAKKITVNGITFDSRAEMRRYFELVMLEKAGEIKNLRRQVKYELIPAVRDDTGRVLERSCSYISDFDYDDHGRHIVEDVKGVRTGEYKIKRKLMLYKYGIRIQEVKR